MCYDLLGGGCRGTHLGNASFQDLKYCFNFLSWQWSYCSTLLSRPDMPYLKCWWSWKKREVIFIHINTFIPLFLLLILSWHYFLSQPTEFLKTCILMRFKPCFVVFIYFQSWNQSDHRQRHCKAHRVSEVVLSCSIWVRQTALAFSSTSQSCA